MILILTRALPLNLALALTLEQLSGLISHGSKVHVCHGFLGCESPLKMCQ